jgi:hypothetical protein
MFNLFKSKEKIIKVKDIVWASEAAKWKGIVEEWKKDNSLVIICWFEATLRKAGSLSLWDTAAAPLLLANTLRSFDISNKQIVFAEHYPLQHKEQDLFKQHSLKEATVYSSLDEPLFRHFGGEKIIELMKKLGMKEDESFEHSMISNAISNAQQKIGKKVATELLSSSAEEWFQKNFITP